MKTSSVAVLFAAGEVRAKSGAPRTIEIIGPPLRIMRDLTRPSRIRLQHRKYPASGSLLHEAFTFRHCNGEIARQITVSTIDRLGAARRNRIVFDGDSATAWEQRSALNVPAGRRQRASARIAQNRWLQRTCAGRG